MSVPWEADYHTLVTQAGLIELPGRTQIELAGADRAKYLHNLCTNEIKKLAPGSGLEAMWLNAKGHILFHGVVYNRGETLVIDTMAGLNERLAQHLDRYLIREQVVIADRTAAWRVWQLVGPGANDVLRGAGVSELPEGPWGNADVSIAGLPVQLRRASSLSVPAWQVVASVEHAAPVNQALLQAGARSCDPAAFEPLRIEAGWPMTDVDITDKNLPQELNRDATAISFVKGCYIGQETVARIDALGHVNKYLARLKFAPDTAPQPGDELTHDGQPIGSVASVAYSPRCGSYVGLGYVRRGLHTPGTTLSTPHGPITVWDGV